MIAIDIVSLKERLKEVNQELSNPATASNPQLLSKLAKESSELTEIISVFDKLEKKKEEIKVSENMASETKDEEMSTYIQEEIKKLSIEIDSLETKLEEITEEKDPDDDNNVILEIRAGAGGDEAAIFAADLYRMYCRFAERRRWGVEQLNSSTSDNGGLKEVSARISGTGAYGLMKFESGVHRVQRVPVTESAGRIHTSTATVAVLPEQENVEIDIKQEDLRIDVFRAGGAGGQCVNTTDSAVRITHLPTGTVVSCQDRKSQLKNKDAAMKILQSRLYQQEKERIAKERGDERRSQIGMGERSEKIRTYNYPQDRITDHRVKISWHNIPKTMDGELGEIINDIKNAFRQIDNEKHS